MIHSFDRTPNSIEFAVQLKKCRIFQFLALFIALESATGCTNANQSQPTTKETAVGRKAPIAARVEFNFNKVIRRVPREIFGTNIEWPVATVRIWDKDKDKLDEACIELAKAMPATVIRFPGGTYSDYYHWKLGIGPRQQRPAQKHVLDEHESASLLGTDEFMELCSRTGAAPMLTANVVTGKADEAAEWVSYCNAPQNALRSANGHAQPYQVKLWEIGNEQYMQNEPKTRKSDQTPEQYLKTFNDFSAKMRAVDPTIKLGAVAGLNFGNYNLVKDNAWVDKLLKGPVAHIDYLCIHDAYAPVLLTKPTVSAEKVYQAFLAAPILTEKNLRDIADKANALSPGTHIAVTEWGPLFSVDFLHSPWMDHPKTLGAALYTASVLHSFMRLPEVTMANFFKLKDQVFMGNIAYNDVPKPSYFAMQLEGKNIGWDVLDAKVSVPSYASETVGLVAAVKEVPYLDALVLRSPAGDVVAVDLVNRSLDRPVTTTIDCATIKPLSKAKLYRISGTNYDANNGSDLPEVPFLRWPDPAEATNNPQMKKGAPGTIKIEESQIEDAARQFTIELPPASISRIEVTVEKNLPAAVNSH